MVNKFYVIVIAKLFYGQVERFHFVARSGAQPRYYNGAFGLQIDYQIMYTWSNGSYIRPAGYVTVTDVQDDLFVWFQIHILKLFSKLTCFYGVETLDPNFVTETAGIDVFQCAWPCNQGQSWCFVGFHFWYTVGPWRGMWHRPLSNSSGTCWRTYICSICISDGFRRVGGHPWLYRGFSSCYILTALILTFSARFCFHIVWLVRFIAVFILCPFRFLWLRFWLTLRLFGWGCWVWCCLRFVHDILSRRS